MWLWTGLKIIWSILSGGGISGVVQEVGGYLGKLSDNKTQVELGKIGTETTIDVAALKAHVEESAAAADLAKYRWGSPVERFLMAAAAFGPIIHFNAVYLDSTFCNDKLHTCTVIGTWLGMPWRVPGAPGEYAAQEFKVIAAIMGYSVARAGVAALIGRVAGKKGV